MNVKISVEETDGEFELDRLPNRCPHCQRYIKAIHNKDKMGGLPPHKENCTISIFFSCPETTCGKSFLAEYKRKESSNGLMRGPFYLDKTYPSSIEAEEIIPSIKNSFPLFSEIYWQSNCAEIQGMQNIAGIGYWQSLEFLLKEHFNCKYNSEEHKIKLESMSFSDLILTHVNDEKILALLRNTNWLKEASKANLRRWQSEELRLLKNLIELTCYWVASERLSDECNKNCS